MRLPLGCALTAAVIGFMASSGCMARPPRAAAPNAGRPAPSPPRVAVASPAPSVPAQPVESVVPPIEEKAIGYDPGSLASILEDPALARVKALIGASDPAGAAKALERAILLAPSLGEDDARWRYQLAKLRLLAGDTPGAVRSFDDVAEADGPLAPYARYSAAQALLRAGLVDESLIRAGAVPEDTAIYGSAQLLRAEALQRKRDFAPAIQIWRDYLSESPHPPRWIEIALRLADALLDERPDASRGEQAALLARRVIVEAPTSAAVSRALDIERQALARVPESRQIRSLVGRGRGGTLTPADYARGLSFTDQLQRASALAEQNSNQEAQKAIEALATALGPRAASTEVGCRTQLLLGSVLQRVKDRPRAAEAYGVAIERCAPYPDAQIEALYLGGKASVSAGRCREAMDRFALVERNFHGHRYADDARLRGAECALDLGDESRYEDMLSAIATDYPEGDMVGEGLFRVALRKMIHHDWAQALAKLNAAADFKVKESPSSTGGRLAYFRARALYESGDVAGARRAFADVITAFPLSYYMMHAYARLSDIDQAEAKTVLDVALSHEPRSKTFLEDDEIFHTPGFVRAAELLRQGETDYARRELGKLGLMKEGGPNQGLWGAASLFARAGLVQISHMFPKNRVFDWLSHYPVGRWREAWEIAYPRPFADVVEREAKKNDLPAAIAYAVMREESAFDPEAVSPARAFGLMQLIFPTAKKVARDVGISCDMPSLYRPETNVALGCRFLADLRARFPVNPFLAIPGYNAGPGAPQRWIAARESEDFDTWVEQIPYEETRRYTKRVLASFGAYAFLYDRDGIGAALRLPKAVAQL